MGILKEQMMDDQAAKRDEEIADIVGISIDEYNEASPDLLDDEKDGVLRRIGVKFKDDTSKKILEKIEGLDATNTFWFDANDLQDYVEEIDDDSSDNNNEDNGFVEGADYNALAKQIVEEKRKERGNPNQG